MTEKFKKVIVYALSVLLSLNFVFCAFTTESYGTYEDFKEYIDLYENLQKIDTESLCYFEKQPLIFEDEWQRENFNLLWTCIFPLKIVKCTKLDAIFLYIYMMEYITTTETPFFELVREILSYNKIHESTINFFMGSL